MLSSTSSCRSENSEAAAEAQTPKGISMMVLTDGSKRAIRVRNTFIEPVDESAPSGARVRSQSESSGRTGRSGSLMDDADDSDRSMRERPQPLAGQRESQLEAGLVSVDSTAGLATGSACDAEDPELRSIGSRAHATGNCRPCRYFSTDSGCRNGKHCKFCHLQHRAQPRPSKHKRELVKRVVNSVCDDVSSAVLQATIQDLERDQSAEGRYLNHVMRSRLRGQQEQQRQPQGANPNQGQQPVSMADGSVSAYRHALTSMLQGAEARLGAASASSEWQQYGQKVSL